MRITAQSRIQNNTWRYDQSTGFLRCTASILKAGVMPYRKEEIAAANPPVGLGDIVNLNVPLEELSNAESIATLEGMPAVVGHVWQAADSLSACGTIAGAPMMAGDYLNADIMITDSDAVRRVMLPDGDPQKLTEISSAGDWSIIWESGIAPDGTAYDGYFVKLRYNHVALLPVGAGRAGASVRIINEKGVNEMEFTRVKIRGKTIRVMNEDVEKVEEIMNEDEAAAKTAISPEQLQAALDELSTLKAETEEKNKRIAELEGTIQAYKDQLEDALSSESVEAAAEEMAVERDEATEIMNAHGLKFGDADKKLRGNDLRVKVINSVRIKNGKAALTADEAGKEDFIKGMYSVLAETRKQTVNGASVVINNSIQTTANMANGQDRFKRMYGTETK